MVANAPEEVVHAVGVQLCDGEDRDHEVPRAIGQRILDAAEPEVLPAELACLEDHLRARVEPGDADVGEAVEQALGRLRGAEPELEHPRGLEGDRVERGDLQVLVAGDLLEDALEVAVGVAIG